MRLPKICEPTASSSILPLDSTIRSSKSTFADKIATHKDEQTNELRQFFLDAQERVSNVSGAKVSVVRVGELAIVRGEARDRRTADLIVTLLGFEPGIDQVRNEIQILGKP